MKYNGFDVPDKEIDTIVDQLECSIAEACEMWLADHDKMVNEEQEKATKMAQKNGKHYEKGEKTRKKTQKERKIDENKRGLLEIMQKSLELVPGLAITGQKNEVELHFNYENANYTVKLTKHRPKK